jgi:hypothetical protein
MKNTYKTLLTLLLFLISNVMLFAETGPGSTNDTGTLEGSETPAAPIDNWLGLLLVLGLLLAYYTFKTRRKIVE